jgi:hypothetical protein
VERKQRWRATAAAQWWHIGCCVIPTRKNRAWEKMQEINARNGKLDSNTNAEQSF